MGVPGIRAPLLSQLVLCLLSSNPSSVLLYLVNLVNALLNNPILGALVSWDGGKEVVGGGSY
jgi:hypothetical protein